MTRPKTCEEENCRHLFVAGDYDPDQPFSAMCLGVRTGVIKGKEKALANVPEDVILYCHLIGAHSSSKGRYTFVENIADQYLDIRARFIALNRLGLLKRTIRSILNITNDDIIQELRGEIERHDQKQRDSKLTGVGTKFIEFSCSCREVFFREYNHDQNEVAVKNGVPQRKYYKPNERDKIYFDVHRKLGHTVYYKKAKMVKRSRVGMNPRWQDWGLHEYV